MQGSRDRGRGRDRKSESTYDIGWMPKTRLGQLVYSGKVTTMSEALASRLPMKEPEIVDILLPEMEDEVLDVNMVQRMTDSGRRVRFAITAVVGNGDGFVGMGRAKGKEVGPTIRNAIDRAKLNIIEVKRGCGSWECGCGNPHTFPFKVEGKCGSVRVSFNPAPRGVGLALGDVAKKVTGMAGIKDAWGFAKGHTKTTVNYSFAAFEALRETSRIKVTETQAKNLHILSGPSNVVHLETSPEEVKRLLDEKKKREAEKIEEKAKRIAADKDIPVVDDDDVDLPEKDASKKAEGKKFDKPASNKRDEGGRPPAGKDGTPPAKKEGVDATPAKKEGEAPVKKDGPDISQAKKDGAPAPSPNKDEKKAPDEKKDEDAPPEKKDEGAVSSSPKDEGGK